MECNVGKTERIIRIVLGIILVVVAYLYLTGSVAIIVYIIAVILLITGIIKFCPINKALKINTCKPKETKS